MKMSAKQLAFSLVMAMAILVHGLKPGYGQINQGQPAPTFTMQDIRGRTHDLSLMRDKPLTILYFFDAESRPSQEGMLSLHQLTNQYKEYDLTVLAITSSAREKVDHFVNQTGLTFPIFQDQEGISELYQADLILPTVCLIGPGLKVLDYFQGGGKTTEVMLIRVAERELQRKKITVAKAISEEVAKKNPENVKAKMVKGYAALKEGNIKEAEAVFHDLSQKGEQAEIPGKEGLAAVYAQKGQTDKALELAREVEKKAPERAYVHVIKGDLLYAQDKKKEAEAEYRQAIQKKEVEPYQEAVRHNQLGRLYASAGQYEKARELYDQAIDLDPYYIEGTTNKGMTYEKEGKWDKALEAYQQASALDKNDTFAAVLARKAQEMIEVQKNIEQKKRIDQLVKDLAERFRSRKTIWPKSEDTWTSRPMILTLLDFQETGGLAERDGLSTVLATQLGSYLDSSGRVQVVERTLIEHLLEELNLGSSELADQETALNLGKVLAAKLIGTGSLLSLPGGTLLSFRFIDTETSAIPMVVTRQLDLHASLEKELHQLNREILKMVIGKYPLRGYLVQTSEDQAVINLGSKQGVVAGTRFEVLEEQKPIKYKGKVLQSAPKCIAEVEVDRVEPDLCYARVLNRERSLKADDKVQEKLVELQPGGSDGV
ncbi:MAG: tetratricopeptide repeat protein [bacterium]